MSRPGPGLAEAESAGLGKDTAVAQSISISWGHHSHQLWCYQNPLYHLRTLQCPLNHPHPDGPLGPLFNNSYSGKTEKKMATHSSILAWEIPWQRSLVGYSLQDHKESDRTQRQSVHSCTLRKEWTFKHIHLVFFFDKDPELVSIIDTNSRTSSIYIKPEM